ncbi:uncharacterized protein PAC_06665 [Phialocephala subalpina]|uniref:Uncharacterized protein n=1 Tax=Phialocephala subalpina TaxID=576137 RepID=A0A1L7WVH4_9HELO|nr:uncharacterized protein PAC_06665 [Phialocephala subalpina]
MRNLILDLRIFAAIHVDLWAEFSHLERLTIVMYPEEFVDEFEDEDIYNYQPYGAKFVRAKADTRFRKRSTWIHKQVTNALEAAKETQPNWITFKVEVMIRATETNEDARVEVEGTEASMSPGADGAVEVEEFDDSAWYEQLKSRMTHRVNQAQLRRLKHWHHPSRRVTLLDIVSREARGRSHKEYFSDSETEDTDRDDLDRIYEGYPL